MSDRSLTPNVAIPRAFHRIVMRGCGLTVLCLLAGAAGCGTSRLDAVRDRGALTCGIKPGVRGFAEVDAAGRHAGLDIDICRAVSAAIFGTPDQVRFVTVDSVDTFLGSHDIDVVSRRLTWSLPREHLGLLFGPVTFYDSQAFLVRKRPGLTSFSQLSSPRVCLVPGTAVQANLNAYAGSLPIKVQQVLLPSLDDAEAALTTGRCEAVTGDISELGSVRSTMRARDEFEILPERLSKEPLAPLVRQHDDQFFSIVRWTVFAMIAAEEHGVTSANVEKQLRSDDFDVRRLLGVVPGNGAALGLDERWAYNVIRTVGNYGEVFERHVGRGTPIGLERGINALWTDGGLMYAPLFRP